MNSFILTIISCILFVSFSFAQFVYVNPLPGSVNHRPEVTIALNPGSDVDISSLDQSGLFTVTGTVSGDHTFRAILSSDKHTIILKPDVHFTNGENITVNVKDGIRTINGVIISGTTFSFSIIRADKIPPSSIKFPDQELPAEKVTSQQKLTTFPSFTISINTDPAPGSFFFCNKDDALANDAYLAIMKNDGSFDFSVENTNVPNDWKMNDNCMFTVFDQTATQWIMVDTNFAVVDSFQCGNGLEESTDAHEFRIYPDGHAYVEADDPQTIDMTQYIPDGDTAAVVKGFTIQRLDADHNVVFEWRSWDYFQITDAVSQIALTTHFIDPVHGNSIDEDFDGNLITSERHMSEITKINGITGDIMWRMGGENNQFTFINDTANPPFYYQHYVRRLPNGHILFFNNNNYSLPPQSSAKEYALDETNKTATLTWSYTHPLISGVPVFGMAGGTAQRLYNGHTVICWGYVNDPTSPNFTEVDSIGNIVFEFKFDDPNQYIYRTTKSIWQTCDAIPTTIETVMSTATINISPNPASGFFTMDLTGLGKQDVSMSISNMLGEVVYKKGLSIADNNTAVEIALPLIPSGIYLCNITAGTTRLSSRVVIQ